MTLLGCNDTSPIINNDPEVEDPDYNHYDFGVLDKYDTSNVVIFWLKGDSVDAKWDFDNNYIWLSTDENRVNGPYCTLTMFLTGTSSDAGLTISSAILSVTDVLEGTAAELNARTYNYNQSNSATAAYIIPKKINEGLFWGYLYMEMVLSAPSNSSEPEVINLRGPFSAKKK